MDYLNGYTRQSILETIERRNGWIRCISGFNENCSYLNADRRTCGAGAFIPESEYSEEFEGRTVECIPFNRWPMRTEYMGLLQRLHDFEGWSRENVEKLLDEYECKLS